MPLYFRCKLTFVSVEFALKTIIYVATGNTMVEPGVLAAYPVSNRLLIRIASSFYLYLFNSFLKDIHHGLFGLHH